MVVDLVVNTFMQSVEVPWLVVFAKAIGQIFDPLVLIVLSLIIAPYVYIRSSKKNGILFGGMILITGGLIVMLKEIFERVRPIDAALPGLSFSFPSGHATMAVVFFGLLVYLFVNKKYRTKATVAVILLITFIGLSRLYLRVHWFTDVLAGFVLGGIILVGSIWLFRKIS